MQNRVRHLQKTDPRKWHQQVKVMTNNNKSEVSITIPGVKDSDHVSIANAINDRFVSVSDHLCSLDIAQLEAFLPAPTPPPTLHTWEVYAELQKIKPSKACGPDGISPKLVKEFSYGFSTPLTDLLNCSFSEGVVPKQWKRAVVVPIPKTHPPREDKLRPVSLTDCFAKVSESFITNWVLEDVSDKIDTQLFGNIKGVSTSHYLVSLLNFLHSGADAINNVGTVVLTDFSKAFDMVDHTLMIEKFIHLEVRGAIVPWLCEFINERVQCVRYNQALSDYKVLKGGLPQGTKVGPLGFQAIIGDAATDIAPKKCWKYVDDLTLAENRTHPASSKLQEVLDDFSKWTTDNKLSLNLTKCQALQVCFKTDVPPPTVLKINDTPLDYVSEAKILGIWIQDNLKWDKNIAEIIKKANRRLYMLRMLKKFSFNHHELTTVYKGYVRPLLEYCDSTWHSSLTAGQSRSLEQLQRRACRIVLGKNLTSYSDALSDCDLDPLYVRRVEHCLRVAEGLSKNSRTNELLPPVRRDVHGRNLRNADKLTQLFVRTLRFQNSPIPYFISLLNE